MSHVINASELREIEQTLNQDQKQFLSRHIQNNIYDTMLGKLVESGKIRKMHGVDDEDLYCLADEYVLVERRVAEKGQSFTCDEGHKNLKYLYVVRNVEDGRIIKLGGTCLKNLTGLSGDVVNALIKCFDGIDREYERILLAYKNGEWQEQQEYLNIEDLSVTMKRQLELELPLSELQLSKVEYLIRRYFAEKERKEQERRKQAALQKLKAKVLDAMSGEQKSYYDQCSDEQQDFIISHFFIQQNSGLEVDFDKLENMPDLIERIRLELPLTYVQESVLAAVRKEVKLKKTRDLLLKSQQPVQAEQEYYSYDEILENYKDILGELKSKKDATKAKCPGTYKRVVDIIRKAKDGEKVKRRVLMLELQGLSNAMGWGYDLY